MIQSGSVYAFVKSSVPAGGEENRAVQVQVKVTMLSSYRWRYQ